MVRAASSAAFSRADSRPGWAFQVEVERARSLGTRGGSEATPLTSGPSGAARVPSLRGRRNPCLAVPGSVHRPTTSAALYRALGGPDPGRWNKSPGLTCAAAGFVSAAPRERAGCCDRADANQWGSGGGTPESPQVKKRQVAVAVAEPAVSQEDARVVGPGPFGISARPPTEDPRMNLEIEQASQTRSSLPVGRSGAKWCLGTSPLCAIPLRRC